MRNIKKNSKHLNIKTLYRKRLKENKLFFYSRYLTI